MRGMKAELNNGKGKLCIKHKSQSALEYLTTYGWAILIIAVVLGALFSLGVFNSNNFSPKAAPGSCYVIRPYGAGSNLGINLGGICNELPEYVASFNGAGSTGIVGPEIHSLGNDVTIVAWVYISKTFGSGSYGAIAGTNCCGTIWGNYGNNAQYVGTQWDLCNCGGCGAGTGSGVTIPTQRWVMWVSELETSASNTVIYQYVYVPPSSTYSSNGVWTANSFSIAALNWTIGAYAGGGGASTPWDASLNGSVSNVQVYNTALSQNDIQALYLEGIGGAPLNLENLVAWWPLNGNANDYSGNGNNAYVYNGVTFMSNWWGSYTNP